MDKTGKSKNPAWFLLFCLVLGCAPNSGGVGKTRVSSQNNLDLLASMKEMDKQVSHIQKTIATQKIPSSLLGDVEKLRQTFSHLKKQESSVHDPELWKQYCEIACGILNDVEKELSRHSLNTAEKSFARIPRLQEEMFRDFEPSLRKRIRR